MPDSPQLTAPSRKGKERQAPQPTDIAEKLYALKRQQAQYGTTFLVPLYPSDLQSPTLASMTKPKERHERPVQSSSSTSRATPALPASPRKLLAPAVPNPNIVVSRTHSPEPDEHDFSRRLKISPSSPRAAHSRTNGSSRDPAGRLYNPNAPEQPTRKAPITTEPDAMSDGASSSYVPRPVIHNHSRSHHPAQSRAAAADGQRLFDPRKDDPTKFFARPPHSGSPNMNGRPTPTPKSSGDYVSASSTSSASYAHSTISSTFTLSSTTTDSSASSAIFDHERRSEESSGQQSALSNQLKRVYRSISSLEEKLKNDEWNYEEEIDREPGRVGVLVKGKVVNGSPSQEVKGSTEEQERERWKMILQKHKELAENMHFMLSLTSAPTLPSGLRNVPIKYNLIIRLWTHAFHKPLESLRKAAIAPTNSRVALELLQEFIYYAYTFYTCLFEERNLSAFKGGWVEALGDLARYRMAVSHMVENAAASSSPSSFPARVAVLSSTHLTPRPSTPIGNESAVSDKAASPTPAARIDDSPSASQQEAPIVPQLNAKQQHIYQPSVGIVAARMMELEPEKERWRQIARDWYATGLAATPGAGKLHHHLGLLSRDKEGGEEELRGVYHFVKSLITVHPFTTSRESIQQFWSIPAQKRRQAPDARLAELFISLHCMLFTNIQLDDFKGVLSRLEEKLLIEGESIEEREWIMMAVVNLGALLEYGKPTAVLRRVSGIGGRDPVPGAPPSSMTPAASAAAKVKLMAKRSDAEDRKMDVDDEDGGEIPEHQSPSMAHSSLSSSSELPMAFTYAMQLTFSMLTIALRKPTHRTSPFARDSLNPYIVIILTFLSTILKDRPTLAILERSIPWEALVVFFNRFPRRLLRTEIQKERSENAPLLTSGCQPLPEDWCLRGLGWGGKKVYERGFWGKDVPSGEEKNVEVEVLDRSDANEEMMDGIIEDENSNNPNAQVDPTKQTMIERWVRVTRSALKIGKIVRGLTYVPPMDGEDRGEWRIEGALEDKVVRWKEDGRREREEEERRLRGTKWADDDEMDVDDEDVGMDGMSEGSEDDEGDTDEVKALKARRRYLQSLLQSSPNQWSHKRPRPRGSQKPAATRQALRVLAGYTILIVDTNILLSSLPMFSRLVESQQYTIIVPLPVIMELDGLAANASPLGEAASSAAAYITSHIRSHSISLKIQTSRGNFLPNLNVRSEVVDFNDSEVTWERNMDDLILRAAIWQKDHWMDRSAFFKFDSNRDISGAAKVVLLSFDRMLRVKARSREVDAADERDLAAILALGT